MMRYILLAFTFLMFLSMKAQDEVGVSIDDSPLSGDVIIPDGQTAIPDSAYYKNTEILHGLAKYIYIVLRLIIDQNIYLHVLSFLHNLKHLNMLLQIKIFLPNSYYIL